MRIPMFSGLGPMPGTFQWTLTIVGGFRHDSLMVRVIAHDIGMGCTVMEYSPVDYTSPTVFCWWPISDGAGEHAKHGAFLSMTLVSCRRGHEGEPTIQQLCT